MTILTIEIALKSHFSERISIAENLVASYIFILGLNSNIKLVQRNKYNYIVVGAV